MELEMVMRWLRGFGLTCVSISAAACSSGWDHNSANQAREGDIGVVSQALTDPYIYNGASMAAQTTLGVAIASMLPTNGFDNINLAWTDLSGYIHLVTENACSGGSGKSGGRVAWATSADGPVLAYGVRTWGAEALRIAWVGTESQHWIHFTSVYGGILNTREDVTIYESAAARPGMTWTSDGLLFLAWRRPDNTIVVSYTNDAGTFPVRYVLPEATDAFPVLTANGTDVYLAWKGNGNNTLNVATVNYDSSGVTGIRNKTELKSSPYAPGLKSYNGNLYLAWVSDADYTIHTMVSQDGGISFEREQTLPNSWGIAAPSIDWCYDRLANQDWHNHPAITWEEYTSTGRGRPPTNVPFLGSIAQDSSAQ